MITKYIRPEMIFFLIASFVAGCGSTQNTIPVLESTPTSIESLILPTPTVQQTHSPFDISQYGFPKSVDPTKQYLFYLHGKIIEEQGIPAISPDYGEYEYQAILERLSSYGFVVISEKRAINTDSMEYAKKISNQVKVLLDSGVPANNITVVGASKGAGITIFVSHLLQNDKVNYVIMAICDPETVKELKQNGISLFGNVLSIYDSADELAGSCQDLFSFSEGKGISKSKEIVLHVGTGHGILFKPLDEWITPVIQWAEKP
jgi:hypothetical protein